MITYYYRNLKTNKIKTLSKPKAGTWIHVEAPTDEEIALITEKYNLDDGLVTDALDLYEVPRIEKENGDLYIFSRLPSTTLEPISTVPILMVITPKNVITIIRETPTFLATETIKQINWITTQKSKLIIELFLFITSTFQRKVHLISRQIRNKSSNLQKISNSDIEQFVQFESVFNDFLSSLSPMASIFQNIQSGRYMQLYEEDKDLIEDLFLSNTQLIALCKSRLKHIVNIREAQSTIISNNVNRNMRLLTMVTFLLTIPTMVSSFFGMNVPVPWGDSNAAFFLIVFCSIMVTIAVFLVLGLSRKR